MGTDSPGVFESITRSGGSGLVGWVVQAYPDERMLLGLQPGDVRHWGDARSRGKEPGQPVLLLQVDGENPRWVGWGTVVAPEERWRVLGMDVRIEEVTRPGFPVVARRASETQEPPLTHEWVFRELGHTLKLSRHRERTPYLDTDARDLRLSASDLAYLLSLQPRLADFGRPRARPAK